MKNVNYRNKTRFSFPSGQQLSISEDQPTAQIQFCAATADQCVPKQESPLVKFTHSRRHGRPSMKKIESLETEEKLLDFDKQIKRKTNKSMFVRNNKTKGTVSHFPGGYHISNRVLVVISNYCRGFLINFFIIILTVWKGGLSGSDTLHDSNGFRYSCYVDHRVKLAAYQKPSDSGAVWRCTTSTPSGPKCNFMLLEKDGTFTEKSIAQHKHGRIIDRSKLKCEVCRTRVEC